MRRLDQDIWVAGQIAPEQVAQIAAQGVTTIINNRPDNEEPGQPTAAEIEAAAHSAGLAYRHIPIAGGFSEAQMKEMADALASGPSLAFCRSGTRSTYLWALTRAREGENPDDLLRKAAEAGYDLSPIRQYLGR